MRGGLGKRLMEEMAFFDSLGLEDGRKVARKPIQKTIEDFNPAEWPAGNIELFSSEADD